MKKNNGTVRCDGCNQPSASVVAVNPHAPMVEDEEGHPQHITMYLCRICAYGSAIGAALTALGIAVMEIISK